MKRKIANFQRANAKRLRANETDAERKLWRALARIPLDGTHFRRQAPIGPFIADFVCLTAKLVIELDGGQHSESAQVARDAMRTAWLEREGYQVVRFWNDDVLRDLESVLDTIYAALYGSTTAEPDTLTPPRTASRSDPPPQGEGG